jgi:hypothetical protein
MLSFSHLVLYTSVVVRTKVKETVLVALHFTYLNCLLLVTIPISVELVRHKALILCLNFGELARGCQLIYRFRTELYFSQQTWIQYMGTKSAILLQVLPPTLTTSCPGTLGLVGSTADCGCSGRRCCRYLGSLPDVLKIHYQGCKTTFSLFYDVSQVTGSNRETRFPRFHYKSCGKMYGTLR